MSESSAVVGPDASRTEELQPALAAFVATFRREVTSGRAGVYLVGSAALGDFGHRSNVDLVAVTELPLPTAAYRRLARSHKGLRHNGRPASVCYATWDDLAGDPAKVTSVTFVGRRRVAAERMANPMIWATLHDGAVRLFGPEPAAASNPEDVRAWFEDGLAALCRGVGNLIWRRSTSRLVFEAVRCAHGTRTGEVVSLTAAAAEWISDASSQDKRILADAAGYRHGLGTGMYWGPFERRHHARQLLKNAQEASVVTGARTV